MQLGRARTTVGQLVTGLVFVALGVFLLVSGGQAGSVLDAQGQYRLENRLHGIGQALGDWPVLVLVIALVGVLTWIWLGERDRVRDND